MTEWCVVCLVTGVVSWAVAGFGWCSGAGADCVCVSSELGSGCRCLLVLPCWCLVSCNSVCEFVTVCNCNSVCEL